MKQVNAIEKVKRIKLNKRLYKKAIKDIENAMEDVSSSMEWLDKIYDNEDRVGISMYGDSVMTSLEQSIMGTLHAILKRCKEKMGKV